MTSHGYTRRDHRNRRRRSRRRGDLILDKLLKIFFGILVILVIVIIIKVVCGDEDKNNPDSSSTSTLSGSNDKEDTTTAPEEKDNSSTGESEGDSSDMIEIETTTPEPTTTPESTTTPEATTDSPTEPSTTYSAQGDYSVFNTAAFVGDSRIGGLYLSSQLTTSTFYYDVGGNVSTSVNDDRMTLSDGSSGSMVDAVSQKQFDRIFIQYGVNEWGWSTDSFISKYEILINEIKAVQPNAQIYVLAIIPVTEAFSTERASGGSTVNESLDAKDERLKTMAADLGIHYINIVEAITGGERVLADGMSSDGYHLNKSYNLKVLDYICEAIK